MNLKSVLQPNTTSKPPQQPSTSSAASDDNPFIRNNCSSKYHSVNPNNQLQQQQQHSLQKIQITIRKYRRHGLANESIERSLMLTKPSFFESLLDFMFSNTTDPAIQIKTLDLITWIFYNHCYLDSSHLGFLKEQFALGLEKFLTNCYLYGTRSTSRKATMLLTLLLNPKLDPTKTFASLLLDKLLVLLKYLLCFESSASLNWFFTLFHQVYITF